MRVAADYDATEDKDHDALEDKERQRIQERQELLDQERRVVEEIRNNLRKNEILPKKDRPIIARNFGRLIERNCQNKKKEHVALELFKMAFPDNWESYSKKRRRFIRFEGEPLPDPNTCGYGEYNANRLNARCLAQKCAELYHTNEAGDTPYNITMMSLFESTSLDPREAGLTRIALEDRQQLHRTMERLGEEALKDPDLTMLFSLAARHPLGTQCDLNEAYEAAIADHACSVLRHDLVRAGFDPEEVSRLDKPARLRMLQGKRALKQWRFTRELDPRGLVMHDRADRLRPAEFVAGGRLWYLHPVIPRLAIGWAYQPLVRQYVHLDLDFSDVDAGDEEFANTVLPAARDAALGWSSDSKSDPTSDELAELWEAAADDPASPVGERVYWERKRLYLAIVPIQTERNPAACLWVQSEDLYSQELIQRIGATVQEDHPLDSWAGTEHYSSYERAGICLIRDIGPWNYDEYDGRILTHQHAQGVALLSGKEAQVLGPYDESSYARFKNVRKFGDQTLIRLDFEDDPMLWTPFRHETLAAAITRNLRSERVEHRLNHLLATETRKLTSLAPAFLQAQREDFERSWEAAKAVHGRGRAEACSRAEA